MRNNYRVFVIGLDGATFDLIRPWVEQGKLPTFERLLRQGAAGQLRSTIPPMTGPAWTSFMTGKNPGKHGLYDWIARNKDSYSVSPVTAQHCQEPALWDLLSQSGRRVCTINVPMTYPPKPVNGLMISGLPAPSTDVTITYPKSLLAEMEKELGKYLLYPDPGQAYSDSGVDAFLERLYRTTEMRLKVIDRLYQREDWDFFMVVFSGTDTVSHAMWKYMDPAHPLHDRTRLLKYGSAIQDFYQYIDHAIGKLIDSLGDDTVVMLMSDHGFGPFHKFIHVNNWLQQQGWMQIKRTPLALAKTALFRLGFAPMSIYNLLMLFGLGKLKREVVRGRGQELLKRLFLSFDEVDWQRTQAYSLGNVGQIFLNVRGREPQGIVEPGTDYERVRDEIMARLGEIRDPETGEKVVQGIYRREEIYSGPAVHHAPDIVFIPTRMEYFGFGEYEFGSNRVIEQMKRGISGTHRLHGIFLLHGEPVQPDTWVEGAQIIDLAPTILHLLGEPIPAGMDGRVLAQALQEDFAPAPVAVTGGPHTPGESGDFHTDELTAEDEETIIQRLRGLGYVG